MKPEVKERPILFSAPMIKAIREGRKTQTRRIVKGLAGIDEPDNLGDGESLWDGEKAITCPYGRPGDRLWVRETWGTIQAYDHLPPRDIPKGSPVGFKTDDIGRWCQTGCDGAAGKWRPSIFMPRWASRITLEIVSVQVELLQEISAEDCIAEGLSTNLREHDAVCDLKDKYRALWDSINDKNHPWDLNPWVWAVEFKVMEAR